MLILKVIDHLQYARRYLIQKHINNVAHNIRVINGAINLLQDKRAENETLYAAALTKREEIK